MGEALIGAGVLWLLQGLFRAFEDVASKGNSIPAVVAGGGSSILAAGMGAAVFGGYLCLFFGELILIATSLEWLARRVRARRGSA